MGIGIGGIGIYYIMVFGFFGVDVAEEVEVEVDRGRRLLVVVDDDAVGDDDEDEEEEELME